MTHVDQNARIQTVEREVKPVFNEVISAFKELTGTGVVVNTSFNGRGELIVCTPKDAYSCFTSTAIDLLVLDEAPLWKDQQPEFVDAIDWRTEYGND